MAEEIRQVSTMTNPYKPPVAPVEESEESSVDPFEDVFGRMISRSAGARWELGGMSFVLWLPVLLAGFYAFSLDVDEPLTLPIQGAFILGAVVLTRVNSILQTSTYLHHARGDSARPWNWLIVFRSLLYLIAPTVVGIVLAGVLTLAMGFAGVQKSALSSAFRVWAFLFPFAFVAPALWAAAPYWVDGAGMTEGLREGRKLLKNGRGSALVPVGVSFALAAAAALVPLVVAVFDVVSKGAFAEAYLRARGEV